MVTSPKSIVPHQSQPEACDQQHYAAKSLRQYFQESYGVAPVSITY